MPTSRLPNYLRAHRKRAALSQDEIAFLLGGKNGARISRYERSKQTPHLRTPISYELLFGTPVRELYGGMAKEVEQDLKKRVKLLIRRLKRSGISYLTSRKVKLLRAFLGEDSSEMPSGLNFAPTRTR